MPRIVMDFSDLELPRHVRGRVAHTSWPHRTADVYVYDALCGDVAFVDHPVGEWLVAATADEAAALFAWFPTAAAFGFWHSNLGKKRHMVRLAGSFQSEIVGWDPAGGDVPVARKGLKGDVVNISGDSKIYRADADDRLAGWVVSEKGDRPVESGDGAGPLRRGRQAVAAPGVVSAHHADRGVGVPAVCVDWEWATATTRRTRRRVRLSQRWCCMAISRRSARRSCCGRGGALSPQAATVDLDSDPVEVGDDTADLVRDALAYARSVGVPVDGWDREPLVLTPNASLAEIITRTWPRADRRELGR